MQVADGFGAMLLARCNQVQRQPAAPGAAAAPDAVHVGVGIVRQLVVDHRVQLADVQAVYDAVSSGGDATASAHMSADMVDSLDTTIGGPGNILTIRKAHFPPGGTVAFGYPDGPITSTEMHLPRDSIYSGTEASSGDVICPVTSGDPSPSWITLSGDYGRYQLWLVLEGRSDGAVEVKELGRNFS